MLHVVQIAFLVLLVCLTVTRVQEPRAQQLNAPPPLKTVSSEERTLLGGIKDKVRVKKTIELAEGHLAKAEVHTSQEQFNEASAELGKYWALIEDLLHYLSPLNHDSTKTRDLYKRLELSLRAQGPRLTLLRRSTPTEYAVWIKELEDFTRTSRTEALNSFYGQTVIREGRPKPTNEKPPEKQLKDRLAPPESTQP